MQNLQNDEYYFVHIPKNCGTSIREALKDQSNIKYSPHYVNPSTIDRSIKQIIILRDIIDRFCSMVYYTIQYYPSFPSVKNLIDKNIITPNLWADCWFNKDHKYHQDIVNEVENLNKKHIIGNIIPKYKWHMCEQRLWVYSPKYVLLYKNLHSEYDYFFKRQLGINSDLPSKNTTNKIDINISSKNIENILHHYRYDSVIYNYYCKKSTEERLSIYE